ncbi:MAG TPA: EF-hand domain-containing protein [Croceibacterium sp.]|nr:EF-hand domain-containing protein [Croceibacterium sp.]
MLAALARLTANEKECLRRRLQQQTAKEMALELGVSPHAVEKRLKMARTKLGLSSSLEAARLLAMFEGYHRTGPYPTDLATAASRLQRWRSPLALGVLSMTIVAAVVIAFAAQGPGTASDAPSSTAVEAAALPPGNVMPNEAEIVHMTQTTFHHLDADNSGYLDGTESPVHALKGPQPVYRRDGNGKLVATGETVVQDESEIVAEFYRRADKDGDGRISYPEFHHWSVPNLVRNGIPARWRDEIRSWMSPEG